MRTTGGLIHRDLAARNVLVSSYTPAAADQPGAIAVQLTDYGLARDVRMLRGGVYVTPEGSDVAMPKLWIPPESLQSRQFTRASDVRPWPRFASFAPSAMNAASAQVWAFGVTLWEIMTDGNLPYYMWACSDDELVRRVVAGEVMPRPDDCTPPLYELMVSCWKYAPTERPDFPHVEAQVADVKLSM